MVILTGRDNSGKTTLFHHLVEVFNLKEVPRYPTLPPVDYEDYRKFLYRVLGSSYKTDTIMDRCYIDEFVYGPIKRGEVGISLEDKNNLDSNIAVLKPIIIVCDPGDEAVATSYGERWQYVSEQENKLIANKYKEVVKGYPFSECSVIVYDYKEDPTYEVIDQLMLSLLRDKHLQIKRLWRNK